MNDPINKPAHYTDTQIEPIDFILANPRWSEGFLCGNIIKYIFRFQKKHDDAVVDLHKARFYLDRLIESATDDTKPK